MYIKILIRAKYHRFIPNKLKLVEKNINKNVIFMVLNKTDNCKISATGMNGNWRRDISTYRTRNWHHLFKSPRDSNRRHLSAIQAPARRLWRERPGGGAAPRVADAPGVAGTLP